MSLDKKVCVKVLDPEENPKSPPNRWGLNADVWAIFIVYLVIFMDALGFSMITPILPSYAMKFGATDEEVGCLFSVFALAQTLGLPVLTHITDRYGRRTALMCSVCCCAIGSLFQGLSSSYWMLFSARAIQGVWAAVGIVASLYVDEVAPTSKRRQYQSYLQLATQAANLFGPSVGAGFSVLGLSVPSLVQAAVLMFLVPIVWAYVPESPEWLKLRAGMILRPSTPDSGQRHITKPQNPGLGPWVTRVTIVLYGVTFLCFTTAQMAYISMIPGFLQEAHGMDSLKVGYVMTLGCVTNVVTTFCVLPAVQNRLGNPCGTIVGFLLMTVGATCLVLQPLGVCLASLIILNIGLAIVVPTITSGYLELTDMQNKAKVTLVVTIVRNVGSIAGPIVAGFLANIDSRLPFAVTAGFALLGAIWQFAGLGLHGQVQKLVDSRKVVGLESAILDGEGWQNEFGTPDEIRELGEYMAKLLSTRHYRWVSYNSALKEYLDQAFAVLPVESDKANAEADLVRSKILVDLEEDDDLERGIDSVSAVASTGTPSEQSSEETHSSSPRSL